MKKLTKTIFATALLGTLLLCGCGIPDEPSSKTNTGVVSAVNSSNFAVGLSSVEMAKNMQIGWNLGNTFDATGNKSVNCETAWGQPKTTKAMIQGIKKAGFKTIRIPVSWHDHITSESYEIDENWTARVKEVVTWALDEGLCVIINIHHDNEAANPNLIYGYALSNDKTVQENGKKYVAGVWKKVAEKFNEFDSRLVFELLNEPRDVNGKTWQNEWWVSGEQAKQANKVISDYEQAALNAIRSTGGNNAIRYIMVPWYAASSDCYNCNSGFTFPTDTVSNKLILSVHAYAPYDFAMGTPGDVKFTQAHKNELTGLFNKLESDYVNKGIGVVIGETGATNKGNDDARNAWASYFFGEAYKKGIPSILWDNGNPVADTNTGEKYGYYNRLNQTWYSPDFIKSAMNSVGIEVEIE